MTHSSELGHFWGISASSSQTVRWWRFASSVILWAGIVFRVGQFCADRCFWIDECFLALNITNCPFADLHKPLGFNQAAPILFLYLQRTAIALFGLSEAAFRIVPLVAACLSLFLFRRLAAILLFPPAACLALALVACSDPLIYYATEAKQYSVDVTVCVGLLYLGSKQLGKETTWWDGAAVASLGALTIMASYVAPFVLAGVGLGYWCEAPRKRLWQCVVIAGVWLEVSLVCYLLTYQHTMHNAFLREYWSFAFAPFPLTSLNDLAWYADRVAEFFRMLGQPVFLLALPIMLVVIGMRSLGSRSIPLSLILLLPLSTALIASICRLYPFFDRTALYLVPIVVLLLAAGLESMARAWRRKMLTAGVMLLVLAPEAAQAIYHLVVPRHRSEMRQLVDQIRGDCRPGDLVYLDWHASVLYTYYRQVHGDLPVEMLFETDEHLLDRLGRLPRIHRIWMLRVSTLDYSAPSGEGVNFAKGSVAHTLTRLAVRAGTWYDRGAALELYEVRDSPQRE